MKKIIGIDGCRAGWIVASIEEKEIVFQVISSLEDLNKSNRISLIGIDMPVNLVKKGLRLADQEARSLLKNRASTVFSAPPLPVLNAPSYLNACELSFTLTGKKISKQSWNIFPKIKEVQIAKEIFKDKNFFYEIHPELSFMAMNNMKVIQHSKKLQEGKNIRRKLIEVIYPFFDFNKARLFFSKKEVADDDILDAVAVLWSTKRIVDNIAESVPKNSKEHSCHIFF